MKVARIQRHVLKARADHFAAVVDGWKSFELRLNDRDFSPGDELELLECDESGRFIGGRAEARIDYVFKGARLPSASVPPASHEPHLALSRGWVILSLDGVRLLS